MAKTANDFVAEILNDELLAQEVEAASDPEAVVLIGERRGIVFTVNEYKQALAGAAYALAESLRGMGADVEFELSIEDLEMVAGGNNNFTTGRLGYSTIDQFEKGFDTISGLLGKRFSNIE